MRTFDGLRLDVRTYGPENAPLTVVLSHCWTLNQADWHYQVRDLQREFGHGIRIVTWDHRGHGASDESARQDCTIENLGRDWADIVTTYATSERLVLVGHSIGGMSMMAMAEQRPEIFERVVGVALVATSSGGLDSVTLGLPEIGPRLKAQIPGSSRSAHGPSRSGHGAARRSSSARSSAGSSSASRCAWSTPP